MLRDASLSEGKCGYFQSDLSGTTMNETSQNGSAITDLRGGRVGLEIVKGGSDRSEKRVHQILRGEISKHGERWSTTRDHTYHPIATINQKILKTCTIFDENQNCKQNCHRMLALPDVCFQLVTVSSIFLLP